MALHPDLVDLLACPVDRGPLLYFPSEDSLYNPRLKRRYRIVEDIPVLLADEAEDVDGTEHQRLMAKADSEGVAPADHSS
jgi:uncharacterized protein YbaR (Trm112 family)